MPTCPTCFAHYSDDVKSCAKDGVALVPDSTFAHVDRDLAEGTVVGEYTIEKKLGEGGFGAVYRAVHPLIGKNAAVKILSREFSANPQMVSRFVAEARAVNQIRHRNIIDIFSFGQLADGRQYYIMELLDGSTFDQYLKARGKLTLADAMPILRGVARALDAAHAKGILHRDLKPENIFLVIDEEGRIEPKLLDFGLVKLISKSGGKNDASDSGGSHKTKTGTPMGTPYYMSPEQSRGHEVDARTDVYSFGAMVFETLTGTMPYDGGSTIDILMQHMNAPIPNASAHGVPIALDQPIAKMLAKSAADRPASVGEALAALQLAAGLPVDSARVVKHEPSDPLSLDERANARTVMAPDTSVKPAVTPATFLGTESDIALPAKKSKTLLIAGAAALLLGAALAVAAFKKPDPPAQAIVASAAPSASVTATVSALPPAPTTVEIKVDGVPPDTTVTADGTALGTGAGPFTLPKGNPVKLVFTAKGFKPKELSITPTESTLLSVSLDKAPTATTPVPPHKPSIHKDLDSFDSEK